MPMVRDVPVFPDRELRVGDTWTAAGHEMHDFRDSFGIKEPYRIPFTANYTYLGQREWKGKSYPAIGVKYRIADEPPAAPGGIWPAKIEGSTDQVIFWDLALGQPAAYQETFQMAFTLSDGVTVEYRGSAEAEVVESAVMNKDTLAEEIAEAIEHLGITDAEVRTGEEGVVISLENIQFEGDSAALLPPERAKLDKIGEILRRYADRDILVGGHTALAGTEQGRMRLSEDRAAAVADYFIARDIRKPDRVVVQGYGAERPLGSNNTEAGRRRNRRVEITVLEN
jgi:outer membrane protein OmpA-like peptidoglycan-associated protein